MHELSLCEGMIELLQEQAKANHFNQIKRIQLEVGRLSCVEPEALLFSFDVVAKGSIAENAILDIDEISGQGWCDQCTSEITIEQRFDPCPLCDHYPLEIRQGDKMRIKYVEVI